MEEGGEGGSMLGRNQAGGEGLTGEVRREELAAGVEDGRVEPGGVVDEDEVPRLQVAAPPP